MKYLKLKKINLGFDDKGLNINIQMFKSLNILSIEDECLSSEFISNLSNLKLMETLRLHNVSIENFSEDVFCSTLASLTNLKLVSYSCKEL